MSSQQLLKGTNNLPMRERPPLTSPPSLWHPWQTSGISRPWRPGEVLVPLVIFVVLAWLGWWIIAGVVAVLTVVLLCLRRFRPSARAKVDHGLGRFAEGLARAVAITLLAPVFYLILTPVGLWIRLWGGDPLRLRDPRSTTFWEQPDDSKRRTRHAARMFATERRRTGRGGILPLMTGAILLILMAEVVLRFAGLGNPLLFVQDPEVGYFPAPNQSVRYPGRTLVTNDAGMRDTSNAALSKNGKIRILMTGDSTLAGTKVSNDELYSEIVERRLNEFAGGDRFEVFNMGVNAWGPRHQEAFFRKFGTFEADVLLICGPVANVFRPKYGLERLPFRPVDRPPSTAISHALYEGFWRLRERTLGAPAWAVEGPWQDSCAAQGVRSYAALADQFIHSGAEVFLEMLPARSTTLGQGADPFGVRHFAPIHKTMKERQVPANLAGAIFADVSNPDEIYYDGIHFDRRGHRLYAEYLIGRLKEHSTKIRAVLAR
jgi:hypothetical protein